MAAHLGPEIGLIVDSVSVVYCETDSKTGEVLKSSLPCPARSFNWVRTEGLGAPTPSLLVYCFARF